MTQHRNSARSQAGSEETAKWPLSILFLSKGNAARSPIAEAILRQLSRGMATVTSAGVKPQGEIHPMADKAVRNVLNARIEPRPPISLDAVAGQQFDYVFTLCDDAKDNCPPFANRPTKIHWEVEDPLIAEGTRDQRQRAFDKVARNVLKRLRPWWRLREAEHRSIAPRLSKPRGRNHLVQWRTTPAGHGPILLMVYLGTPRRCTNICAYLERFGFQVLCGDTYSEPETLRFQPDVVAVRVDGVGDKDSIRREFLIMRKLRSTLTGIPMVMLVDHAPSEQERELLQEIAVDFFNRYPKGNWRLITMLDELVNHPPRS